MSAVYYVLPLQPQPQPSTARPDASSGLVLLSRYLKYGVIGPAIAAQVRCDTQRELCKGSFNNPGKVNLAANVQQRCFLALLNTCYIDSDKHKGDNKRTVA